MTESSRSRSHDEPSFAEKVECAMKNYAAGSDIIGALWGAGLTVLDLLDACVTRSEMASKTLKQERHDTLEEVLRRLHDLYNLHRVSGTTDTGRGIALAERSVRELRDGVKP
jgi:hypothetical protein